MAKGQTQADACGGSTGVFEPVNLRSSGSVQYHGSATGPVAPAHEQLGARQLWGPSEQHRSIRRGSVSPG